MSARRDTNPYDSPNAELEVEPNGEQWYDSPFDGAFRFATDLRAKNRLAFMGYSTAFLVACFLAMQATIENPKFSHNLPIELAVVSGLVILARFGALAETGCYLARLRGEPVRWRDHVPSVRTVVLTAPSLFLCASVGFLLHEAVSWEFELTPDLSIYLENFVALVIIGVASIISAAAGPSWVDYGPRPLAGLRDGFALIWSDVRGFTVELPRIVGWWLAACFFPPIFILVLPSIKGTFAVAWVRSVDAEPLDDPYGESTD